MAAFPRVKFVSVLTAKFAVLAVLLVALPMMSLASQPAADATPTTVEVPDASRALTDADRASATAKAPWVAGGSLLWKSKLDPQPPLKSLPGC